jgi:hypothetical protein
VPQQVLYRRLLLRRSGHQAAVGGEFRHFQVGQLRQIHLDRVAEQQLAFFEKLHDDDRGHQLGHRRNRKHRVRLQRIAGRGIAHADRIEPGKPAMSRNTDHATRHPLGVDFELEHGAQQAEPLL